MTCWWEIPYKPSEDNFFAEPETKPELCYCGTIVNEDPLGLCHRCRLMIDGAVAALRGSSDTLLGLLVIAVLETNRLHRDGKKRHKRCVSCLPAVIVDAAVDIREMQEEHMKVVAALAPGEVN